MKKNKNNIIADWLKLNSTKEIEDAVKKEIELGNKSPLVNINTSNDYQ